MLRTITERELPKICRRIIGKVHPHLFFLPCSISRKGCQSIKLLASKYGSSKTNIKEKLLHIFQNQLLKFTDTESHHQILWLES